MEIKSTIAGSIMDDEASQEKARRAKETLERLKIALYEKHLVIVVGAGVTLAATADASGKPILRLTWEGLIQNGLDYLVAEDYEDRTNGLVQQGLLALSNPDPSSLLHAASLMVRLMQQHKQLPTWLESVFGKLKVTQPRILEQLRSLRERGAIILTTNYDSLLEDFCNLPRLGRSDENGILRFKRRDLSAILHVHGSYHDPSEVVLDATDYYKVQQSNEIQSILRTYMEFNKILFIGCGTGLEDPNFGALLDWAGNVQGNIPSRHCVLLRDGDKPVHHLLVSLRYGAAYEDLPPFLEQLLEPLPSSVRSVVPVPAQSQPFSSIPEDRAVEHFYGRDVQLQLMKDFFSPIRPTGRRTLILQAMGGQGKTQIAFKYCQESKETYRDIFWIYAASEAVVLRSYQKLAESLLGISIAGQSPEESVKAIKSYLENWTERWLIVFDNYDDPENFRTIRDYIPNSKSADVLFTSRNGDLERLGKVLPIPAMPDDDGVSLLLRTYNVDNIEPHKPIATKIVRRLGGLALAIDQAVAYIKYQQMAIDDLDKFLERFEKQQKETEQLLSFTDQKFWEYDTMQVHADEARRQALSAFTTWEMSFSQLEAKDESRHNDAAHFLSLSAFLDGARISEFLFRNHTKARIGPSLWLRLFCSMSATSSNLNDCDQEPRENGATHDHIAISKKLEQWKPQYFWHLVAKKTQSKASPDLHQYNWDSGQFWDTVFQASKLSLLHSASRGNDEVETHYSFHPLIRDWLRLRQSIESRRQYTKEACHFVVSSIKKLMVSTGTATSRLELLAHVDACVTNDVQFNQPEQLLGHEIESCVVAGWFASYYHDSGNYKTSEQMFDSVLRTQRKELGDEHHETLASMNSLALALGEQGQYAEAEAIYRETLRLREEVLGKEHPDTLTSMNNLASVLNYQGEYAEAEEINRETLRLREEVLGKEHPDTLISMNNLASVLYEQGKYAEAEEILRETLRLREEVLKKEHPDTLISINNLALVLDYQGEHAEAEEIYRDTLRLREEVLGKKHLETLRSMGNLASCLKHQGRYSEAEVFELEVLQTRRQVLGSRNPSTLITMNNYAATLRSLNRHEEATKLMEETVLLMREVLGDDHPYTIDSIGCLGEWREGISITPEADNDTDCSSDSQMAEGSVSAQI